MNKCGSEEIGYLNLVPPQGNGPTDLRNPPPTMPECAKRTWRALVESLPANWFAPVDLQPLREYCVITAIFLPQIDALIEAAGITSRELRTRDALVRQSARLAEKLRLGASGRSQFDSRKRALADNQPPDLDALLSLRDCDV